jgi:hypothetical protein
MGCLFQRIALRIHLRQKRRDPEELITRGYCFKIHNDYSREGHEYQGKDDLTTTSGHAVQVLGECLRVYCDRTHLVVDPDDLVIIGA